MRDRLIRADEVRKAVNDSAYGHSGLNVYAMDSKLQWQRIIAVKTHRGYVYGKSLNTDKWFVIHQWDER